MNMLINKKKIKSRIPEITFLETFSPSGLGIQEGAERNCLETSVASSLQMTVL